jgi:HEAT repeat protein
VRTAFWAFTLLVSAILAAAQQESSGPSISHMLEGMKNSRWMERSKAFEQASKALTSGKFSSSDNERLKLGIIQMLTAENRLAFPPDIDMAQQAGTSTDTAETEDEDFYPELVTFVAGMDDDRAIPALAGCPESTATEGLLKYGDKALDPLIGELKSPNALVRANALSTIISFWGGHSDSALRTRIRQFIRYALIDPNSGVRSNAVNEIACLDDRKDFVPALQKLAGTDPEHYRGQEDDGVDGDQFYPVRLYARRALREIQNDERCLWRRTGR